MSIHTHSVRVLPDLAPRAITRTDPTGHTGNMASRPLSKSGRKTASTGVFDALLYTLLSSMLINATEQHVPKTSSSSSMLCAGFCTAALAFTAARLTLWVLSRAGRWSPCATAHTFPRYASRFRYTTLFLPIGAIWSVLASTVRILMSPPAPTGYPGGVFYRFSRFGHRFCRLSVTSSGSLSFFAGASFCGPSMVCPRPRRLGAPRPSPSWCTLITESLHRMRGGLNACLSPPADDPTQCEDIQHILGYIARAEISGENNCVLIRNFDESFRAHRPVRVCDTPTTPTVARNLLRGLLLACALMPTDAAESSESRLPRFDGSRSSYRQWLLAFSAYVALKYPDVFGILDRSRVRPAPGAPQAERDEYQRLTRQLCGAVVQCVPSWLMSSLHHVTSQPAAQGDEGRAALDHLHQEYGATTPLDRTAAMSRLHLCHFDSKAAADIHHLRYQYDQMREANADLVSAGGAALDDAALITLFDAAVAKCTAYDTIRMFVRQRNHGTLADHYDDYVTMVKAELQMADLAATHTNATPTYPALAGRGGPPSSSRPRPDMGRARGGRGRGRGGHQDGPAALFERRPPASGKGRPGGQPAAGRGRAGGTPNGRIIMCFRCLALGHARQNCTRQQARCTVCGGDHDSSLHSRTDLSRGQQRMLLQDARGGRINTAPAVPTSPPDAVLDELEPENDGAAQFVFAPAIPMFAPTFVTRGVSWGRSPRPPSVTTGPELSSMRGRAAHEVHEFARALPEIQAVWFDRIKAKIIHEMIYARHAHPRPAPRSGHPHPDLANAAPFKPCPANPTHTANSAEAMAAGYFVLGGESPYLPTPDTELIGRYANPGGYKLQYKQPTQVPSTAQLQSRSVKRFNLVNAAFLQIAHDVLGVKLPPPGESVMASVLQDPGACELTYVQWKRVILDLDSFSISNRSHTPPAANDLRGDADEIVNAPIQKVNRLFCLHRLLFHTVAAESPAPVTSTADPDQCPDCDDADECPSWTRPHRPSLPPPQTPMPPQCQSPDILAVLFDYVFDVSWPRCAREGCPCTSTFNGRPGRYCCNVCRLGRPCTDNWHPTPRLPPDPSKPAPVACVCKVWRDAWDAKCEEWVCAPYPSAAYFLQRCVAYALTPQIVWSASSDFRIPPFEAVLADIAMAESLVYAHITPRCQCGGPVSFAWDEAAAFAIDRTHEHAPDGEADQGRDTNPLTWANLWRDLTVDGQQIGSTSRPSQSDRPHLDQPPPNLEDVSSRWPVLMKQWGDSIVPTYALRDEWARLEWSHAILVIEPRPFNQPLHHSHRESLCGVTLFHEGEPLWADELRGTLSLNERITTERQANLVAHSEISSIENDDHLTTEAVHLWLRRKRALECVDGIRMLHLRLCHAKTHEWPRGHIWLAVRPDISVAVFCAALESIDPPLPFRPHLGASLIRLPEATALHSTCLLGGQVESGDTLALELGDGAYPRAQACAKCGESFQQRLPSLRRLAFADPNALRLASRLLPPRKDVRTTESNDELPRTLRPVHPRRGTEIDFGSYCGSAATISYPAYPSVPHQLWWPLHAPGLDLPTLPASHDELATNVYKADSLVDRAGGGLFAHVTLLPGQPVVSMAAPVRFENLSRAQAHLTKHSLPTDAYVRLRADAFYVDMGIAAPSTRSLHHGSWRDINDAYQVEPNLTWRLMKDTSAHPPRRVPVLVATQYIMVGDELFYDYSDVSWRIRSMPAGPYDAILTEPGYLDAAYLALGDYLLAAGSPDASADDSPPPSEPGTPPSPSTYFAPATPTYPPPDERTSDDAARRRVDALCADDSLHTIRQALRHAGVPAQHVSRQVGGSSQRTKLDVLHDARQYFALDSPPGPDLARAGPDVADPAPPPSGTSDLVHGGGSYQTRASGWQDVLFPRPAPPAADASIDTAPAVPVAGARGRTEPRRPSRPPVGRPAPLTPPTAWRPVPTVSPPRMPRRRPTHWRHPGRHVPHGDPLIPSPRVMMTAVASAAALAAVVATTSSVSLLTTVAIAAVSFAIGRSPNLFRLADPRDAAKSAWCGAGPVRRLSRRLPFGRRHPLTWLLPVPPPTAPAGPSPDPMASISPTVGRPVMGDADGPVAYPAAPLPDLPPGDEPVSEPAQVRVLLLFSGAPRQHDIGWHLRKLGVVADEVDILRGVDLVDAYDRLLANASDGRYAVVFASPPCSTFSVARLQLHQGPPQLRSRLHPHGVPGLSPEDQKAVDDLDMLLRRMLTIMRAAAQAGAALGIENPVPRGDPHSPFYQPDLADHLALWDTRPIKEFMGQHYMLSADFPMCAFPGWPYQKYTRIAFTPALRPMLRRLAGLRCRHRTHPATAHGFTPSGESHSELAAQYPPALSALLAQAFSSLVATCDLGRTFVRHAATSRRASLPADATPVLRATPAAGNVAKIRMHIDTMAPYGVTSTMRTVVRVQEQDPDIRLNGLSGAVPVQAVVTLGFWAKCTAGHYAYLEIPDCFFVPESNIELYPVQHCFSALGWRHAFDDVCNIILPDGHRIKFESVPGKGYHMDVLCQKALKPGSSAQLAASGFRHSGTDRPYAHPSCRTVTVAAAPATLAPDGQRRRVDLLWRRLAFPSADVWRHVHSAVADSGLSPGSPAPVYSSAEERLAVARGRMRAGAFPGGHHDDPPHGPLYKVYMDFAGPTGVAGIVHKHRHFCGVIDAYSGYAAVYGCCTQTGQVAVQALQQFLISVRVLLKAASPLTPTVVRTDRGTPFMSQVFVDFVRSLSAEHSPSVAYTPQQNAPIERLWGTIFNMARVMLALARLPPSFIALAVRHAAHLAVVLPSAESGTSRIERLCNRKPNIQGLRVFGCSALVYLHKEVRYTDDKVRAEPVGKKLTDRATAGIYVGSASPTPGHLIYLATPEGVGRLQPCRDVVFDETLFPGVTDTDTADTPQAPRAPAPSQARTALPDAECVTQPPARYALLPGPPQPLLPGPDPAAAAPASHTGDAEGPRDAESAAGPPVDEHRQPPLENTPNPRPLARDPGPTALRLLTTARPGREQPLRLSRTGPYAPSVPQYADPTYATRAQAEDNFALLSTCYHPIVPAFAFQSAAGDATVVRPVADPGDVTVPKGYSAALKSPESSYWKEAIVNELNGLMANDTWKVVARRDIPHGANLLNCHFTFALKRAKDGSIDKFKARLVADGNTQRHGVDFDRVFSTVVKMSTVRLMLMVAVASAMELSSLDVRQAFLHAKLDRPLYMRMPPGLPKEDASGHPLVLCLHKSLYGLRQAGREWNQLFVAFLLEYGFAQSTADTCLFTHTRASAIVLMIVIWVDDIICAHADRAAYDRFATALAQKFPVERKETMDWVLGIRIDYDRRSRVLRMSQAMYADEFLRKYASHLEGVSKRYDSPMADDASYSAEQCPAEDSQEAAEMAQHRDVYMSVVGGLLWLSACTRPDLTYATSVLARFVSNPARTHYAAMQRVLAYLRSTINLGICMRPDTAKPPTVYADASWAERFSTSGGVILAYGGLVHWWSRLQRTVSHSSAEAEYIAASLAAREAAHVRALCLDLKIDLQGPTPLRLDSKSAIDMAHDPVAFKKTKHIMRESHYLRDLVARRVYLPQHVPSADQLADILTKAMPRVPFTRLRDTLLSSP